MSPLHFVIMLIVAIIILTVLTLKFKMPPVMVLFFTATFCGLASGKTLVDTFAAITKYFGSTLGSIGVMIIFGAVIASGINDTGAATSMVNFFIKKFKGKCLELAPALILESAKTFRHGYRNVVVVKKMTFPNDKILTVEMTEKQISGRNISLNIDYEDVLSADSFNADLLEEE